MAVPEGDEVVGPGLGALEGDAGVAGVEQPDQRQAGLTAGRFNACMWAMSSGFRPSSPIGPSADDRAP